MSSWLAGDVLVEREGIENAERKLQQQLADLEPGEKQQRNRVLGALGRVRMLQEVAR